MDDFNRPKFYYFDDGFNDDNLKKFCEICEDANNPLTATVRGTFWCKPCFEKIELKLMEMIKNEQAKGRGTEE